MRLRAWTTLGLALVVAAAFAGSTHAVTGTTVKVTLKEFSVGPSPKAAKAGTVKFVVHNSGKINHSFVVVKTNLAPGKLPMKGTKVNLSKLKVIGQIASLKPKTTKTLATKLSVGKYVLFCNMRGHYKAGQYKGFIVSKIQPVRSS